MTDEKKRVLALTNDPNTIMSYGILIDQLMLNTSPKYSWHLIAEEYKYGKPEFYGHFIKYSSGVDQIERDSEIIPEMINNINPLMFLTVGDLQYFKMVRYFVRRDVPWIHWTPIDHHDKINIQRYKVLLDNIDIPLCMSKYAFDFAKECDVHMENWIYPFIKTKPTATDKERLKLGEDKFVFKGFRPVDNEPNEMKEINNFIKTLELEKSRVLMFVGRPGWRKNVEFLIGILNKLITERERKECVLYMHTDINDPSSTTNIAKLLHAFSIPEANFVRTKSLKWHIGVPTNVLNALYNMTRITGGMQISAQGGEGFGLPIAEGMATKLPFVSTDCTTTPEFTGNRRRGLAAKVQDSYMDRGIMRPFVDLEDFCDQIEYLLDHDNQRTTMGVAGRKWVEQNCSYPVITKKWYDLFDKIDVNRAIPGGLINEDGLVSKHEFTEDEYKK